MARPMEAPVAAADGLAEFGRQPADGLVHHRACHLPRHLLADREGFAALALGAEEAPDHVEDAAAPGARSLRLGHRLLGAFRQHLVGRFRVERLVVLAAQGARLHQALALGGVDRTHLPARRRDQRALHHRGRAAAFQRRDQGLADAELRDRLLGAEGRVLAEGLGRHPHGLLVAGREGAQRMLHPVAELGQHAFGHVGRVLGDEIDAHALGADEPHHALDGFDESLRRVVEEEMRLVEEEHELRLVEVADFGQFLEQLRHEPEQKGRVKARAVHEPVGREDVHHPAPVAIRFHQVADVQRRLAEERFAALVLEHEKLALDRAHRGLRDVAVSGGELLGVLGHELQQRAQVLEIEEQQTLFVRDAEDDVEHALLGLVQVEEPREKERSHFRDRGADPVALLAEQVPEHHGKTVRHVFDADLLGAFDEGLLALARRRHAREVALDVGGEHRHARIGEALGQHLQRHGLARARGAGDEAVPVRQVEVENLRLRALADQDGAAACHRCPFVPLRPCHRRRGAHFPTLRTRAGPPRLDPAEARASYRRSLSGAPHGRTRRPHHEIDRPRCRHRPAGGRPHPGLPPEGGPARAGLPALCRHSGSEQVAAQSGDGGPGASGGGFMGMMGGGVMALGQNLMSAGVSMGQMQPLGRELFAYGREKAGEDVMGPIVGSIPGLSQFV
jgi:hypothetical protein